jgi:hypothetical protein
MGVPPITSGRVGGLCGSEEWIGCGEGWEGGGMDALGGLLGCYGAFDLQVSFRLWGFVRPFIVSWHF